MKTKSLFLLLISTTIAMSGCSKPAAPAEDEKKGPDDVAVEMAAAETKTLYETVEVQGILTSPQNGATKLAPVQPGRISAIFVKEGDRVTAGQLIATIDNLPQKTAALSSKEAVSASESLATEAKLAAQSAAADQRNNLKLAQLALESARLDARNSTSQAEIAVQAAKTDLQKMKNGSRPQEIAQAQLNVEQANATQIRAKSELDRVFFLYEKGVDSKRQWEDAQTALALAVAAHGTAIEQLKLVKAGNRPEDIKAAEIRLNQANETLAQTKSLGDAKVKQAEASLRQVEQTDLQVQVKLQDAKAQALAVRQKRADLATASATVQLGEVRSPISGTVTKRNMNPGDVADITSSIVEINSQSGLNLVTSVSAEDGSKLSHGMPCKVSTADIPGQTFSGAVLSIGQIDPSSNLLSVRLNVDNSKSTLKIGGFCKAEIIVRKLEKAVTVPKEAVVSKDGAQVVFTVGADGKAHKVPVVTGVEFGQDVEISKGLKPGDKIIRLGQFEINDNQKVHPAGKKEESKPEDKPTEDEKRPEVNHK